MPFKLCTDWLSGSKYPTLPNLLIAIGAIRRKLERDVPEVRTVRDLEDVLLDRLNHYFAYLTESDFVKAAYYLNPTTRSRQPANDPYHVSDVEGRKATLKCLEALNLDKCEDTEKKTSEMDSQQKPVDSFDSLINDFFDQPADQQHHRMSAEERYEDEMMTIFCEYEMRARSFAVPSDSSSPPKKKTKHAERDAKSSRYERFWIRCDDLSPVSTVAKLL
ncbi:hypothetical protein Pmar_PMAR018852, partial [Perkinsus marinus ATCC 50983]